MCRGSPAGLGCQNGSSERVKPPSLTPVGTEYPIAHLYSDMETPMRCPDCHGFGRAWGTRASSFGLRRSSMSKVEGGAMTCQHYCTDMVPVSASDCFDENGYIGFTAWQCRDCGRRTEEISAHGRPGRAGELPPQRPHRSGRADVGIEIRCAQLLGGEFPTCTLSVVQRVPSSTLVHVSASPPCDPGRSAFPSPVLASALLVIFQKQAFPYHGKLKCPLTYTPTRSGLPAPSSQLPIGIAPSSVSGFV